MELWVKSCNPFAKCDMVDGPEVVKMRMTGTNGKVPGTVTPDFGVDPSNCNAKKSDRTIILGKL